MSSPSPISSSSSVNRPLSPTQPTSSNTNKITSPTTKSALKYSSSSSSDNTSSSSSNVNNKGKTPASTFLSNKRQYTRDDAYTFLSSYWNKLFPLQAFPYETIIDILIPDEAINFLCIFISKWLISEFNFTLPYSIDPSKLSKLQQFKHHLVEIESLFSIDLHDINPIKIEQGIEDEILRFIQLLEILIINSPDKPSKPLSDSEKALLYARHHKDNPFNSHIHVKWNKQSQEKIDEKKEERLKKWLNEEVVDMNDEDNNGDKKSNKLNLTLEDYEYLRQHTSIPRRYLDEDNQHNIPLSTYKRIVSEYEEDEKLHRSMSQIENFIKYNSSLLYDNSLKNIKKLNRLYKEEKLLSLPLSTYDSLHATSSPSLSSSSLLRSSSKSPVRSSSSLPLSPSQYAYNHAIQIHDNLINANITLNTLERKMKNIKHAIQHKEEELIDEINKIDEKQLNNIATSYNNNNNNNESEEEKRRKRIEKADRWARQALEAANIASSSSSLSSSTKQQQRPRSASTSSRQRNHTLFPSSSSLSLIQSSRPSTAKTPSKTSSSRNSRSKSNERTFSMNIPYHHPHITGIKHHPNQCIYCRKEKDNILDYHLQYDIQHIYQQQQQKKKKHHTFPSERLYSPDKYDINNNDNYDNNNNNSLYISRLQPLANQLYEKSKSFTDALEHNYRQYDIYNNSQDQKNITTTTTTKSRSSSSSLLSPPSSYVSSSSSSKSKNKPSSSSSSSLTSCKLDPCLDYHAHYLSQLSALERRKMMKNEENMWKILENYEKQIKIYNKHARNDIMNDIIRRNIHLKEIEIKTIENTLKNTCQMKRDEREIERLIKDRKKEINNLINLKKESLNNYYKSQFDLLKEKERIQQCKNMKESKENKMFLREMNKNIKQIRDEAKEKMMNELNHNEEKFKFYMENLSRAKKYSMNSGGGGIEELQDWKIGRPLYEEEIGSCHCSC